MHRLFIAFTLPDFIIDALAPTMEGGPPGLRWIEEDNLHCTLRFIGTVETRERDEIVEMLSRLRLDPLHARVDGVGVFDHGRRGALWARLAPKPPLKAIHDKLDRALVQLGHPPERRAFLPHVTLARWSGGRIDSRGWAERHAGLSSPHFEATGATLFESQLLRTGARYEAIANVGADHDHT